MLIKILNLSENGCKFNLKLSQLNPPKDKSAHKWEVEPDRLSNMTLFFRIIEQFDYGNVSEISR